MKKTICCIGSTGFIGSNIYSELIKEETFEIYRFSSKENKFLNDCRIKQFDYLIFSSGIHPESNDNNITEKKLIGFTVFDTLLGKLGTISAINSQTTQQLIFVKKDSKEFCFPMHEQFVKKIDTKEGIMQVEIPEEFLDLN